MRSRAQARFFLFLFFIFTMKINVCMVRLSEREILAIVFIIVLLLSLSLRSSLNFYFIFSFPFKFQYCCCLLLALDCFIVERIIMQQLISTQQHICAFAQSFALVDFILEYASHNCTESSYQRSEMILLHLLTSRAPFRPRLNDPNATITINFGMIVSAKSLKL